MAHPTMHIFMKISDFLVFKFKCMIQKVNISCQDCICDALPALCDKNEIIFNSDTNVKVYNFSVKVASDSCNNIVLLWFQSSIFQDFCNFELRAMIR